jgi:YVTN family beta-propeller protein
MNRFRFVVSLSILVMLPLLQACGATPAPVVEGSPAAQTPVVEASPAAQTPAPDGTQAVAPPTGGAIARNPSSSSPIAISEDDSLLAVVNNLDDSVSIINVAADANTKVAQIEVGDEPRTVAISPDKQWAYVTNQGSGTVSVINLATNQKEKDVPVGIEPYGIALTPDGTRGYVANSASNTVSVMEMPSNEVIATIAIPGIQPRGVAITNNNGGQGQQFVYVTQFLSLPTASGGPGLDQGSEGKVFVLSTTDDAQIQGVITLSAHDTGFAANRTAFGGTETDPTFAYPNQLQAVVLKNGRGYLPNVAASPEGPVRFNVDTQAFLSVFDVAAKAELSGGTINLHAAVKTQTFTPKLFVANPWAIAFKHASNDGYVASAASDVLVKITLDDNGVPSVVSVPAEGDTTRVALIDVGKNPRGVVVNNADTRAYVLNYISKDVSVIDLTASPEAEIARIQSADLPAAGSDGEKFLLGNELFNSSRGEFDEGVAERMSSEGWQACASCHPDGLSDGVVWAFASGPRKSVPLNGTFSPKNQTGDQRVLNYSAVFDELEDFELNIRGVSGGQGLIVLEGTTDQDPNVKAFDPPSAGRTQLHVNGIPAWDAIVAWTQSRIPSPVSPYRGVDPNSELGQQIAAGRQLFTQANCQICHGGAKWSTSQVDFARVSPFPETLTAGAPPEPPLGQLARFLHPIGTFDPANALEKNANNQQALGTLGFNPPSLLSIYAFPPYLHNGSCLTLECVLENETHRNAGGTDVLDDAAARSTLVQFLISIDLQTEPISP